MVPSRILLIFAALNGAMAVATGAFAAHGASPAVKTLLTTGAGYQLAHAVLAVAVSVWSQRPPYATLAGWLAASGGLVFSLALSLIALLSLPAMGAVAPIGGVLMIGSWLLLAFSATRMTISKP
ncbi:DUF423 domain-containing protein [Rhizobium sp. CRIBSB]|nr:DUF423 domain-containing protein [Rhizobium sp. CRIBSB]